MRTILVILMLVVIGLAILAAIVIEGRANDPYSSGSTIPDSSQTLFWLDSTLANGPVMNFDLSKAGNVVFVGGGSLYTTITAGVAAAASGNTVYIWPGTYADSNVVLTNKKLSFVCPSRLDYVLIQAGDTLFDGRNALDSCSFENIYFKGTGAGNLMPFSAKDWWAFNCTFDCSTFVPITSADVTMRNCNLYPRKMDAWTIGGAGYWWTESCQLGEPLAVSDHGISYDLSISQGTFSIRGGHFYSDSTIIKVSGTGSVQAYEGAEFFLRTSSGADTGICAIQVTGGNFNAFGGCKIKNAAPDSATIQVWGTATVALAQDCWIENKGGGKAYINSGTGASTINTNILTGGYTAGANDVTHGAIVSTNTADNLSLTELLSDSTRIGALGSAIRFLKIGTDAFTTTSQWDSVTITGMQANAVVMAVGDNGGVATTADIIQNIDVYTAGGGFCVWRQSGSSNTSGLAYRYIIISL